MIVVYMAWELVCIGWEQSMAFLRSCGAAFDRFNQHLAEIITNSVGTMICAYLFALLAFGGFPGVHASPQAYVQWGSSNFIQLVLLPIIMVGQALADKRHAKRHKEVLAAHAEHGERLEAYHDRLSAIEQHVYGKRLVAKRTKAKEQGNG